ncbi:histone deacetylase family protein [Breoghania sp. L-A4]|uniref:histone deacetylase family protein n=1 Tax=Breoghania sp. L-A4 TaxID=2304600 RepID=UPI000E3597CD|nr:histone deacetylase family protein [Breoghania sp. L-A4]AXS38899.1 histone deacetylase family protein [Breoghania sp. L-A4]
MKTVFSELQLNHRPTFELSDGAMAPAVELPARAEFVRDRIVETGLGAIQPPDAFGRGPLERVHSRAYLDFMDGFRAQCEREGRTGEVFPFCWPTAGLRADVTPRHLDGQLGRYSFDAGTPIGPESWRAAKVSADTALSAARLVKDGERAAFALCRPPGHHAMSDRFGGYCFVNNAAVAAQYLRDQSAARIAILDVDYHHGNGTQEIFYERSDVLFLSIHADPADEYPYFLGYADETGTGEGAGFNQNWPLAIGTDWDGWSAALDAACGRVMTFGADVAVISLGLDPYEHDPISRFRLQSGDFTRLGARLEKLGLPTLFVMEGGYAIDALGVNCVNVLSGFEDAR